MGNPLGEIRRRVHVNADQHLGVCRAAILRALAQIEARFVRIDPHDIDLVGNQIHLAGQIRHPEAVIDVGRGHGHVGGRGGLRVAGGKMQFIGRNHARGRIAIFPPILMANHHHVQRVGRLARLLVYGDDASGGQKKHHQNQNRNHRPQHFDLIAAVDLRWIGIGVAGAMAEADDGVEHQPRHGQKDGQRNGQNQHGQAEDRVCRRSLRREDAGGGAEQARNPLDGPTPPGLARLHCSHCVSGRHVVHVVQRQKQGQTHPTLQSPAVGCRTCRLSFARLDNNKGLVLFVMRGSWRWIL